MAPKDQPDKNVLLEGYRQLADQLRHEETLSWKRLETFLVVSSALIALIGLFWPQSSPLAAPVLASAPSPSRILLSLLISGVGLAISVGWIVVVRRSEAFHDFRYVQLIEMEAKRLRGLSIFTKADEYFSTGSATINGEQRQLDWLSRRARIYQVMTAVPIVLAIVWLVLLAYFAIGALTELVSWLSTI